MDSRWENDRDAPRSRVGLETLRRRDAVKDGHGEIHDDHIGPQLDRGVHRYGAVRRQFDSETLVAQVKPVEFARVSRIVGDEYKARPARI